MMLHAQPDPDMTPDEAAGWWLARLDDAPGAAEQRRFEAWRDAAPDNAAAVERLQALRTLSKRVAADPDILALRREALNFPPAHAPVSRARRVAAAVAFVAVLSGGVMALRQGPENLSAAVTRLLQLPAPDRGRFATGIGERSTVTLRDGSVITLNTDSIVEVAYCDTERNVTLVRGQAIFEVAHQEKRPFAVVAGDRRVIATGTAFDVRLAPGGVEVTLLEGHVIVDQPPMIADPKLAAAARAELQPGERLVAKRGAPVTVAVANINHVTSWRSGQLVFLDTKLGDALGEINRYTTTPIVLAAPDAADLRVNGVFRTGQPLEFAQAVAAIYGLSAEATGADIRLARPAP